MKHLGILLPLLAVAGLLALAAGCTDDSPGTSNNNNARPCNYDDICDSDEGMLWCVDCYSATCNLASTSGTAHDFLVSEVDVEGNGVDLDGDGVIDNKLFRYRYPIGGSDMSDMLNAEIAEGTRLLVGRVIADQLGNDDAVLVQMLKAVVAGGATPLFDGNDTVALDPDAPQDIFLCGRIVNNTLEAGPGNLEFLVSFPWDDTLDITLARVQLNGTVTEAGWEDVMFGGGLSREEIVGSIYPRVLEWTNAEIAGDATGSLAVTLLDLFDDRCDPTLPGCDPLPDGCGHDLVIRMDELTCNALLEAELAPDVDIDGDGVKDLLSLGYKIVSAVPVTVVP